MAYMAPFETFRDHGVRERSSQPYNDAFINRCREKALEYNKLCKFLRPPLLRDLKKSVPFHYQGKVFEGIANFD